MKSRQEILQLLESNTKKIKSFGVKEIGVFGSVVRDEQKATSDVDVLVELTKETLDGYMSLLFFLEDLFDAKVDLVMKDAIKPIIKDRILSETIYVEGL
jgi:uncharacterized protein